MKLKKVFFLIVLGLILVAVMVNCFGPSIQLHYALKDYSQLVTSGIPEDLRLTIYYISPCIFTRYPLSIDGLMSFDDVKIIDVNSGKLTDHWALLRTLDASALQPVKEETYLDVRLYYVFETDDGKLLEVAISSIYGNAFVNGIEVEHNPVFYEIILPFISEEDRDILGITTE